MNGEIELRRRELFETGDSAVFSEDRRHRYFLSRRVSAGEKAVLFVMLNPSTADQQDDDPTIRRCIGFARAWGFGRLLVVNLFSFRATYPDDLAREPEKCGPRCDDWIVRAAKAADHVVVAWGAEAAAHPLRVDHVIGLFGARDLRCLGTSLNGHPRHPLYIKKTKTLEPWSGLYA